MKYTTVSKRAAAVILALSVSSCGTSLDRDVSELSSDTPTAYTTAAQSPVTVRETEPPETSAATTSLTTTTAPETSLLTAEPCKKVVSELSTGFMEGCLPVDLPITWIGDSYSAENVDLLRERFSDLDLGTENEGNDYCPYSYIQSGKHTDWISFPDRTDSAVGGPSGVDIIDGITDFRPYLVFALGTNDPGVTAAKMTATLDHIAEKVGDKTTVVLMTSYIPGGDYDAANEAKRKYAEEHENFYTADWASAALEDYYIQSSIHPYDNGGYNAWADLFYFTLLQIEKERQAQ